MRYIGIIILCLTGLCSYSQPSLIATKQSATSVSDYMQWHGVLDGHMPVRISLNLDQDEASGYIEYGANKDRYELLGAIMEDQMDIYQYDDYSKIMGKITGDLSDARHNWTWSNEAGSSIKSLQPTNSSDNYVVLYESSKDDLFLRPNTRSIIGGDEVDDLKWASYNCDHRDCEVIDPMHNQDDKFQWDGLETVAIDFNNQEYTRAHTLNYVSESYHDSKVTYSFYYPVLQNEKFDNWINQQVATCKTNYQSYRDKAIEASDQQSFVGDFYISALGDRIMSGYLNWSCNATASVETIPFIYDIDKSKFYEIDDLLRSDFDYAFFLEQYLKKEKNQSLKAEDQIIRSALKRNHFKHYVLTHQGIVFFTEFNTLFGRRSILVPYQEIQGFVDNKNINNYFNKRA